jgi:hypothetical protein
MRSHRRQSHRNQLEDLHMKPCILLLLSAVGIGTLGVSASRATPMSGVAIDVAASAKQMTRNVRWCDRGCGWGTWGYGPAGVVAAGVRVGAIASRLDADRGKGPARLNASISLFLESLNGRPGAGAGHRRLN